MSSMTSRGRLTSRGSREGGTVSDLKRALEGINTISSIVLNAPMSERVRDELGKALVDIIPLVTQVKEMAVGK